MISEKELTEDYTPMTEVEVTFTGKQRVLVPSALLERDWHEALSQAEATVERDFEGVEGFRIEDTEII